MTKRPYQRSPKLWVLADQAVVSGTSFATNILIARTLGIAGYGKFSVLILVQLFLLGIQQAVSSGPLQVTAPRFSGKEKSFYIKGVFYSECLFLLLLTILGLLLLLFLPSVAENYYPILLPGIIGTVLFLAQDFLRKTLLSIDQEFRTFFIDALTNTLQLLLLAFFIFTGKLNLVNACWVVGLTFIPSVVLGVIWVKPGKFIAAAVRQVIQIHKIQGTWMMLSTLLQWFAGNFFVVAAGWWLGFAALGALRLAQYLFGLLNVALQAIENYTLPRAAKVQQTSAGFNKYLWVVLRRSVLLITPVLILLVILARPLLTFAGGQEYKNYAYVMYGLSAAYLLIVAGIPVRIALRAKFLNRNYFTGYLLAAIFSLSNAGWMIRQWELTGVLTGLFITQVVLLSYWIYILTIKKILLWR